MIDFWLAAGLLLLIALSFLLIPVLRGRRAQREEDRTALNVALYQERLAELQQQLEEGVLNAGQLEAGRAEAARELLADTEGVAPARVSSLGKALPLLAAIMVPVLGLGLYLHYGSSDKVELTREFSQPPQSLEEMVARLERAAAARPCGGRLACSSRWAPVTQLHSERRRCAGGSRPRSVVVLSFSPYVFHPPFPPPPLPPHLRGGVRPPPGAGGRMVT